jgi:hypothetical protein
MDYRLKILNIRGVLALLGSGGGLEVLADFRDVPPEAGQAVEYTYYFSAQWKDQI